MHVFCIKFSELLKTPIKFSLQVRNLEKWSNLTVAPQPEGLGLLLIQAGFQG